MNLEKTILPAPKDMKFISKYALVAQNKRTYAVEHCVEHDRYELINKDDFYPDLGYWYRVGLHPRFSIIAIFRKAHQRAEEMRGHMGHFINGSADDAERRRAIFFDVLKKIRTSEEFLKAMYPRLFVDLRSDNQTYRVTNAFKDKVREKSFTVEDFFTETNQELRRIILRSGLSIKDVLRNLKLVAEDEEGKLYDMPEGESNRRSLGFDNSGRYLYVVCPSTGQEYLLGVPRNFEKPADARRWTFNLPNDAQFVKEA